MEMTPQESCRKWKLELDLSKKADDKWTRRVKKIVKRYRDERSGNAGSAKKYNILWSNIQTTLPAVYARTPKADVSRRFKDSDPVGRTASEILERCLQFDMDNHNDFDESMKSSITDWLLGGRGTTWVRFEQEEVETVEPDEKPEGEDTEPQEAMQESTPVDYVYWEDFRCSPARVWAEVTWVARRLYMSRGEGIKRFGDDFKQVSLTHVPVGLDALKDQGASQGETDAMKKAEVWEIWDKTSESAIWIAEGYDKTLDEKEDPYGLDDFWPCPKPLYATQTTDTLEPVPDYSEYQDQAEEVDMLTNRISQLVDACKVVGLYDASQTGVQRMLSEGVNNTMIPVTTWAAFSEKGGIKGVIDWMPLDQVLLALRECYTSRAEAIKSIYDITGISDIIRGSTDAQETATAQGIKSRFGALRLKPRQRDVAQFASQLLKIKAQLMADLYSSQTLKEMSGIMGTEDAQYADQAIKLLKSEPIRAYRVEVAADSLVELDEEADKQSRVEFLGAVGKFMAEVLPVAQAHPPLAPLCGEMLLFGIRGFKAGRSMEAAFDTAVQQLSQPQPQQPSPEMIKIQGEQQMAQAKMQADQQVSQQKMQQDAQMAQIKAQAEMETEKLRMQMQSQVDNNRQQAESNQHAMKVQQEAQLAQVEAQFKTESHMREMDFQRWKAELDAATKIEVAKISATKVADTASAAAESEIAREVQ